MQGTPFSYYHYTRVALPPQSCTKSSSASLKTLRLHCQTPHTSPPLHQSPVTTMSSSLAILLLLMPLSGAMAVSPSYISRTNQQQIIASVAPAVANDADVGQSTQPFLASPSGVYAAYLRRAADSSAGGGPGADACYVQIEQADGGVLWESECTLVGGADACELAFSPVGLELFAGGHSLWDTGIDAEPATLSLDDGGDMRIVSQDGVTPWRASGEPWSGQMCGAAVPVSSSPSSTTTSAKLLTPPASTTVAGDLSFGDQIAPPADTLPGSPDQPPADTLPDQPLLSPPPADATPISPELPMPPPPADTYPVSPPDQPLYSSPPPARTAFVPHTPLPPVDVPTLSPPSSPGDIALPPAPAGVVPHQHVPPHHLPSGSSPAPAAGAVPDAMAPSGGHGTAGELPFGQGQQQGAFGQHQVLNGAGQPLEDSSGERPRSVDTAIAGLVGLLIALFLGLSLL